MCIIVATPAGVKHPDRPKIEFAWESNQDYGGIMYVDDRGRLMLGKYKERDEIIDNFYEKLELYGKENPVVLHLRNATDGSVTLDNTHPFRLSKSAAFCHNGRINQCIPAGEYKERNYSDTRIFRDHVLKQLPPYWYESTAFVTLLEEYIGQSRVVYMKSDGKVVILNAKKGEWLEGSWFSNTYYKWKRAEPTTTIIGSFNGMYGGEYGGYISDVSNEEWEQIIEDRRKRIAESRGTIEGNTRDNYVTNNGWACDGCGHKVNYVTNIWLTNYEEGDIGPRDYRKFNLCSTCRTKMMRFFLDVLGKDEIGIFQTHACDGLCDSLLVGEVSNIVLDVGEGILGWMCSNCFHTLFKDNPKTYGKKLQWFTGDKFSVKETQDNVINHPRRWDV